MIVLPTTFPPEFGHPVITVDQYRTYDTITLGAVPGCHQYTACAFATIDEDHQNIDRAGRHAVRLQDGTIAWYEQHPCVVNCEGSATLVFRRQGIRFAISIKAGTLPQAIILANGLRQRH
jgi:hypothetical protein